jgi:hypothetical protein
MTLTDVRLRTLKPKDHLFSESDGGGLCIEPSEACRTLPQDRHKPSSLRAFVLLSFVVFRRNLHKHVPMIVPMAFRLCALGCR